MANHHVFNNDGTDISETDTWLALSTNELPDGITLTDISLLELLQKQEKLEIVLPLVSQAYQPYRCLGDIR